MSASAAPLYGLVGEFHSPQDVVGVAQALHNAGFSHWDVYGPAPIEEIDQLVRTRRGFYITIVMVAAAIVGACLGYFIQYWDAVTSYPINVGGRPYNSWPGFVPTAWEICALFTVYFGFFAFLLFCRLTRLYHPLFAVPGFERATQDRFFVCVEASDQRYEERRIRDLFAHHRALEIAEVAP